ncbi:MAG: DUF2905 family protein [Myxococcales bacterium]|nr:DUF2905 family protein [Myxococcales bacterium]
MGQLGKVLLALGAALVVLGALLLLGERLGLGRLPGDIVLRRGKTTLHVPLMTSLLLSILLTLIVNLWLRRK